MKVSDLSSDQREVYASLISWVDGGDGKLFFGEEGCPTQGILTIGGFAGTGKSTLLGVFAAETKRQVAYVTLTGRASSVLRTKLKAAGAKFAEQPAPPENLQKRYAAGKHINPKFVERYAFDTPNASYVGTIHSLLYRPVIDEKTEELKGWVKRETLDRRYELLVVDEASMVDEAIMRDLQSYGVPIVAVGDHGQLPPVMGSGSLMKSPDLRLEKIHRQAEGDPIIQLSAAIRETGELQPQRFDGRGGIRFMRRDKPETIEAIFREARSSDSLLDVAVLCWANKTRIRMNSHARKGAGFRGCPNLGEIVICLKNAPPVFNGMRAQLMAAGDLQGHRVMAPGFFKDEGFTESLEMCAAQFNRERVFSNLEELQERLPGCFAMKQAGQFFDYGYGLTVHKSQGSQFQHAVVYVDRRVEPWSEDWRRWAYTAVTRSAGRLTVFV